jgi:hypothetical protein
MARFIRGNERGAVSGYVVGVVVLAVLLVGGVMLLKNIGGNGPNPDKPVTVSTGEFKSDEKKDEIPAKTEDKPPATTNNKTENTADNVAATGATSGTPEKITATGPEDFVLAIVGLLLTSGTFYMAWNYAKSRAAVKSAMLRG